MTSIHDFDKILEPTTPDDTTDPPRFGQPVETTKDAFVIELRKFFDRAQITSSRLAEIPTIRKYDVSTNPNEGSLETAVKLIQKFPDVDENLPLVAVLGSTGRNLPMGIGGAYVAAVAPRSTVTGSIVEPFALVDGDTITFSTTTKQKEVRNTVIQLRASRFANIAAATVDEIIGEIKFQALYAKGSNGEGKLAISFGGPLTHRVTGDIEITGGTAIAALGLTVGQKAEYINQVTSHRYHQATYIDIAIEVAAEDYNIRTELTDLVWSFFTFYMDSRDYTFLGRSTFNETISNETYQVIIKPDPSMAGEQEVPRPNDETDKIFVNRLNIPVTTIQYVDRAALVPGTQTPLYVDANGITLDDTIPFKN